MAYFQETFGFMPDHKGILHDVNTTIKELREHSGLSLEEAAARLGVEPYVVQSYEEKKRITGVVTLCHIVESLGGRLAVVPEESKDDPHCQFIELEDA